MTDTDMDCSPKQAENRCAEPMCRGGEISYPEWEGETQPCPVCYPTSSGHYPDCDCWDCVI